MIFLIFVLAEANNILLNFDLNGFYLEWIGSFLFFCSWPMLMLSTLLIYFHHLIAFEFMDRNKKNKKNLKREKNENDT